MISEDKVGSMIQKKRWSRRWYRKLPFPVSKVIGGFYCLFDNGLSYTWCHLWGKVGRRLKSCGKLPNLADALLVLAHETGVSTSKPAPAKPAPAKPVLPKLPAEGNAQLMQELRLTRAEIVALRKEFSVREEYLETLVLRTRVGNCRPSVSVVVVGASTREEVIASMKDLQTASIYELEILFAVDGANDEARNAIKELQRGDGRICIIDSNGRGLAEVRNEGLSRARGDYIAFMKNRLMPV